MNKLKLDLDTLGVETFATAPEMAHSQAAFMPDMVSRRTCIEQCTTSCTF
jgi:hypothetical protein